MTYYDFVVKMADGTDLPSFMIPKIDGANKQFLEVFSTNYSDVGKYHLKAEISKYQCAEDVYFTVTIDTPPIITIATPIVIYEDIKTKVSLAATDFYDIDMHNFIDYKIYNFPATVPETWPSVNNIWLDWGENIDFNIFYLYYTAVGTYRYLLQAIDIYDKVTYYQFDV